MLGFEYVFLFGLALIWIIFAVVQDLKTTEISNWLNFSLILFALGFRFFYSFFELSNFDFFYQGVYGFLIFFALGNLFYYSKMFAGGDARLMYALGAILPVSNSFFVNLRYFLYFIFVFLLVGALYGIFVVIYFGIKNRFRLKKEFVRQFKKRKILTIIVTFFSVLFLLFSFYNSAFVYFAVFVFVLPYFYLYVKAVDKVCMVRKISTSRLMLGDWLYDDVKIGRKKIKATWDGLDEGDIKILQKKKYVWIRAGVQFAPVFLISFLYYFISVFFNFDFFNFF